MPFNLSGLTQNDLEAPTLDVSGMTCKTIGYYLNSTITYTPCVAHNVPYTASGCAPWLCAAIDHTVGTALFPSGNSANHYGIDYTNVGLENLYYDSLNITGLVCATGYHMDASYTEIQIGNCANTAEPYTSL